MAENKHVGHARYSAINSMGKCRLWTWLAYREQAPGFQNHFAKIGTAIHEIMEDYGKHCLENALDTDIAYVDKIRSKHIMQLPEDFHADAKQITEVIKESTNWGRYSGLEMMIEKRFYLDENFEPCKKESGYLSGGIDLVAVDDNVVIAEDYKTVRAIYTRSFMRSSLQRKIYSLLLMKHLPEVDTVAFSFNFLRYGFRSEPIAMSREELPEVEAEVRDAVKEFYNLMAEEEAPEASPGGHCILCEARARCEAYRNAYDIKQRIESPEDAIIAYKQWRIGQIKVDAAEEMIKAWINHNSPIAFDGEEYGPKAENSVKYNDVGRLLKIFEAAKVPIGAVYEALSISNTNVKQIVKRFKLSKEVQKEIENTASKGKATKFKLSKVEYEDATEENEFVADPYL